MVYVFLGTGFEELEALSPVDVLRRGGVEVRLVSVERSRTVTGAHGIPVTADCAVEDIAAVSAGDCLVLPGGLPGVDNLEKSEALSRLLRAGDTAGALLCAICAAPRALGRLGLLDGRRYTCYPGMEAQVRGGTYVGGAVVETPDRITGEGPGAAMPFALAILVRLRGQAAADQVRTGMCFHG